VREISNLQMFSHFNVVKFYTAWIDSSDGLLHMLLEYCDGGDLDEYAEKHFPLSESTLLCFFTQLLIGLDYMHTKHCLHRDIKLQNVLLCRGSVPILKIADFGLSKTLTATDAAAKTCLGTPLYFSPEIAGMREYTRKTDVWSMGVLMYQLMTNRFPFTGHRMEDVLERIRHHNPEHPCTISPQYSTVLGNMVMRMLSKSRTARPTARELLQHAMFKAPLHSWPWCPSWRGCRGLFVCRDDTKVNIRAEPSLQAAVLGQLSYGDQIIVSREVEGGNQLTWHVVVAPVVGFCITAQFGKTLFQRIDDVTRASPLTAQRRGADSPVAAASPSPTRRGDSPRPPSPVASPTAPQQQQQQQPHQNRSPIRLQPLPPPPAAPTPQPARQHSPTPSPYHQQPYNRGGGGAAVAVGGRGQPLSPFQPRPLSPIQRASPIRDPMYCAVPLSPRAAPPRPLSPLVARLPRPTAGAAAAAAAHAPPTPPRRVASPIGRNANLYPDG
jgi:serine/threonine protein kinase